jgi:hypothetical protein
VGPALKLYRRLSFRTVGVTRHDHPGPEGRAHSYRMVRDTRSGRGCGRAHPVSIPAARGCCGAFHNAAISDILSLRGAVEPMLYAPIESVGVARQRGVARDQEKAQTMTRAGSRDDGGDMYEIAA